MKAQKNMANGGVGVTYSNVILAGGLNPSEVPRDHFSSNTNMTTAQAMQAGERAPNAIAKYHCVRPARSNAGGGSLR